MKRRQDKNLCAKMAAAWIVDEIPQIPTIPEFHSREEYDAHLNETRAKRKRLAGELYEAIRPFADLAKDFLLEDLKVWKMKTDPKIHSEWPCQLPPELWLKIAENLDPLAFLTMACTTRRWRELLTTKESMLAYYRSHVCRWGVEVPKMRAAIDALDAPNRLFSVSMILMYLAGTWVVHGALRPTCGVVYRVYPRSLEKVPFRTNGAIGFKLLRNVVYADGTISESSGHDVLPGTSGERIFTLHPETRSIWDITSGSDTGIIFNPGINLAASERKDVYAIKVDHAVFRIRYENSKPIVQKKFAYKRLAKRNIIVQIDPRVGDDGKIYSKNVSNDRITYTPISYNIKPARTQIWDDDEHDEQFKWVPTWIRIGSSGEMSSYKKWRMEQRGSSVYLINPDMEVIFVFESFLNMNCKIGHSGVLFDNCAFFFFTFKTKSINPSHYIDIKHGRVKFIKIQCSS